MSERPKIISSVANAPLQGLFKSDFARFGQGLRAAGYEGVSALPYRAKDIVDLYRVHFPPIILVEDAWNPGQHDNLGLAVLEGIRGHIQRARGDAAEPPILQDTLFFPSDETSVTITDRLMRRNPDAYYGATDFDSPFPHNRTLVHIQRQFQAHDLTSDKMLRIAEETGTLLLFDPTHLLDPKKVSYPGEPTHELAGEWERQLQVFASKIAGVDIHASSKQEIYDLLHHTGKLHELALAAQELCVNLKFLRVEALVPLTSQLPLSPLQQKGIDYLAQIAEALKSVRNG